MKIQVVAEPFDPLREQAHYQESLIHLKGKFGATASFLGTMRDFNEGDDVRSMVLEHYPGMTEKHLRNIVEFAGQRWRLLDALLIHRVGELEPNDPIVLIAVWSAHRADAFEACRFIMEDLKSKAPLWKKERSDAGERWVEKNTAGYKDTLQPDPSVVS